MHLFANHDLEVSKELPEDGILTALNGWPDQSMRQKFKDDVTQLYNTNRYYYYCKNCEGYIKGVMIQRSENSLGPLRGRKGQRYICQKCLVEQGFSGCVS